MPKAAPNPLLNLTNAYLAVEDLLKCELLSLETRRRLQTTLKLLDKEAAKLMREHAEQGKKEKKEDKASSHAA